MVFVMNEIQRCTTEQINTLHKLMANMPQAPSMETTHQFHGGMYIRTVKIPAGNLIVSKKHKTDHIFIGISGKLMVSGEGENYILEAGSVILSDIGTKRAVFAHTDVICMTIHRTDKTSTDGLEEEMIEDDGFPTMYNEDNSLKDELLEVNKFEELNSCHG